MARKDWTIPRRSRLVTVDRDCVCRSRRRIAPHCSAQATSTVVSFMPRRPLISYPRDSDRCQIFARGSESCSSSRLARFKLFYLLHTTAPSRLRAPLRLFSDCSESSL